MSLFLPLLLLGCSIPFLMRRPARPASFGWLTPHIPYLGVIIVMAVLAGLPLLHLQWMDGHDTEVYPLRNVEFFEGLKDGQLHPIWAADFNAGYGEPSFNFIPPGIFYSSAFFHMLGFDFVASEDLAGLSLLLLAGIGMYFLAAEFFGRRGGLVSAVAYLFAPYLQVNLYVRHALLDFSAFAFIPLTLWGLYRFARQRDYRFLVVGSSSLALLLLSSNPVALITFPFLLLMVGWLAWMERSVLALLRGAWCLALGLGLSAFFWLPALAERGYTHLERVLQGYWDYHNHFLDLSQIIYSPWGYGASVAGPDDGMSFGAGPVHLLVTGAAALLLPRVWRASRRAGFVVAFGLALVLGAAFMSSWSSAFIWDRLPILHYLEFPWRFLSLLAVGTALLSGFPLLLTRSGRLSNGLMVAMIAVLLVLNFPHATPKWFAKVDNWASTPSKIASKFTSHTNTGEYIPIWVQDQPMTPPKEPLTFIDGQGKVLTLRLSPTAREFLVQAAGPSRLRVNTFYFPGWKLYVDGNERLIDYSNPQGVMEFFLEPGQHNVVVLFTDTPIRTWATWLSLLAIFAVASSPWIGRVFARRFESEVG